MKTLLTAIVLAIASNALLNRSACAQAAPESQGATQICAQSPGGSNATTCLITFPDGTKCVVTSSMAVNAGAATALQCMIRPAKAKN